MADIRPAEVFPPGEFIRDELEARGWTQENLAEILGRPLRTVNAILTGKKSVEPETAIGLAKAFGTSAEFWMGLESAYQLSRVEHDDDDVAVRAKIFSTVPVKDLIKRRWINGSENVAVLQQEVKDFLETDNLDTTPNLLVAARMTADYYKQFTAPQIAWLCRCSKLGRCVLAKRFDANRFERSYSSLHSLVASQHDVRRVPQILSEMGVRLILVEHLPKTHIDGATVWIDDQPVVAVSLRHDRIDSFWFTLCHELMHVKYGDGVRLDVNLVGEDPQPTNEKPEVERRADDEAANFLVPREELDSFIARTRPFYSKVRIVHFANRIKVHPGIILGQLQRRKEVGYWHSREFLVKVRDSLMQGTVTDGWGNCPTLTRAN
jgi:HTH-type transcriptional regulator / antitoxin HigA